MLENSFLQYFQILRYAYKDLRDSLKITHQSWLGKGEGSKIHNFCFISSVLFGKFGILYYNCLFCDKIFALKSELL